MATLSGVIIAAVWHHDAKKPFALHRTEAQPPPPPPPPRHRPALQLSGGCVSPPPSPPNTRAISNVNCASMLSRASLERKSFKTGNDPNVAIWGMLSTSVVFANGHASLLRRTS